MEIYDIFDEAIKMKASDIHLTNNSYPVFRKDGELFLIKYFPIMTENLIKKYYMNLINKADLNFYEKNKYLDSSFEYNGSRFRLHIYREMNLDAVALRLIPMEIPTFKEYNIPEILKKIQLLNSGFVIITGVTGSGKSTTIAAILNEINENYKKHIITIENPIEFVHKNKKSIISQREIGKDVLSFSNATREVMREDPDIILIGEMRDLDTISNAVMIAETGHLVLSTLHTGSVPDTIDRIIDVFPSDQQEQIRIQLADSIQAIVCQSLIPKIGGGRVPCCEIMFQSDAIRAMIKKHANPNSIIDQMSMESKKTHSQTKIQSLVNLVKKKLITSETAFSVLDINGKSILSEILKKE